MAVANEVNAFLFYNWDVGDGNWGTSMNVNLRSIGSRLRTFAMSRAINDPPASPQAGDRYIVGAAPTGAWIGHISQYAWWDTVTSSWLFLAPLPGDLCYIEDENVLSGYITTPNNHWSTGISLGT